MQRCINTKQNSMVTEIHDSPLSILLEIATLRSQMRNCPWLKCLILYFYIRVVYIFSKRGFWSISFTPISSKTTDMKIHCTEYVLTKSLSLEDFSESIVNGGPGKGRSLQDRTYF